MARRMTDKEQALIIWDNLLTFIARYEIYGDAVRNELKALNAERADNRAYEALIGQFLTGIELIEKEDRE